MVGSSANERRGMGIIKEVVGTPFIVRSNSMDQRDTASTFGYKWENFPVVGPERSKHFQPEHRIRRNGWTKEEFEDWIQGRTVLDAGCGMGWWTDYLSNLNPAGSVYGVDIAAAAVKKGRELGYEGLVIGDIGQLPFPDETFDYIACEEALHHTPDPPAYLEHLVSKLKSGGAYTMYIYKKKPLLRETADSVIRERTTKMDIESCVEFSEEMAELGRELHSIDDEITVPDVELLDIEEGSYSVHEFVYRYLLKCYFDWEIEDWDTSVAVNFDWYHPEFAYRYSENEVREMVANAGLEIDHFSEMMSGYSVRAVKNG